MFAVNYGRIGEAAKADAFFQRGWVNNILGGMQLWHEVAGGGGANNFITGAGGFLQSVFALYGGLELVGGALHVVAPRPPPNCTGLAVRGARFLGAALDVTVNAADAFFTVTLTAPAAGGSLVLAAPPERPAVPLPLNEGVKIPTSATAVISLSNQ